MVCPSPALGSRSRRKDRATFVQPGPLPMLCRKPPSELTSPWHGGPGHPPRPFPVPPGQGAQTPPLVSRGSTKELGGLSLSWGG